MSPDWRQMRQLVGGAFLADTAEATEGWADGYLLDEDRPAIFAAIEEAIRTRSLFELEHRVRRTDGSVGWVASRAMPITGADGRIVEWFGAATDVTERRDAADRLLSVRNEQEFILRFSDALRPVRDPVDIQSVATRTPFAKARSACASSARRRRMSSGSATRRRCSGSISRPRSRPSTA